MTTTTDKLTELVNYLDARLEQVGGYSLSVTHYDFESGKHLFKVHIFPDTVDDAQAASDALNLNFRRNDTYRFAYDGHRDGIEYVFQINRGHEDRNPDRFTPHRKDPS